MKIRNLWLLSAMAMISIEAESTQQQVMQTDIEADSLPRVSVTDDATFWSATHAQTEDGPTVIRLSKHSRDNAGLFTLSDALVEISEQTQSVLTGLTQMQVQSLTQRHDGGVIVVFSGVQCDEDDTCEPVQHFMLAVDSDGESVGSGLGQTLTDLPATSCDADLPPSLHWQPSGYQFLDQCGDLYELTQSDSALSDGERVALNVPDGAEIREVELDNWQRTADEQDYGWRSTRYTLSENTTLSITHTGPANEDNWQWQTQWSSELERDCDVSGRGSLLVRCLDAEGQVTVWQLDEQGSLVNESQWAMDEADNWQQMRSYFIDDHLYSALVTEDGNRALNTNSQGEIYSDIALTMTLPPGNEVINTSAAEFSQDSGGQFIVMAGRQDQKAAFLLYDYLPLNLAPRFLASGNQALGSDTEYEFELTFADEETLQKDIEVSVSGLPDWLTYDEQTRTVSGSPYHDQLGLYQYTTTINADGQEASLTTQIQVVLTPWQINYFEEKLFEQLERTEPLPVSVLVDALGAIPVYEDSEFAATLSRVNRTEAELSVSLENLPVWLSFDAESMVLSGQPTQMEVGEYPQVSFRLMDEYAEDGESETLAMPIEVIEVDEAFTVTSEPDRQVQVGLSYQYQLSITDEESDISELTITPGAMPEWLSYDSDSYQITGVPPASAVGDHLVQLEIRDPGGNRVLHSFTLTVTDDPNSDSGGGSMWWLLPLTALVLSWRRARRCGHS